MYPRLTSRMMARCSQQQTVDRLLADRMSRLKEQVIRKLIDVNFNSQDKMKNQTKLTRSCLFAVNHKVGLGECLDILTYSWTIHFHLCWVCWFRNIHLVKSTITFFIYPKENKATKLLFLFNYDLVNCEEIREILQRIFR